MSVFNSEIKSSSLKAWAEVIDSKGIKEREFMLNPFELVRMLAEKTGEPYDALFTKLVTNLKVRNYGSGWMVQK